MKVLYTSLLAMIAIILCIQASAQDIIYTISGEINSQKTSLDSIAIENLSKQSTAGFGNLPVRDDYRISLTRNEYLGSTSATMLKNESGLFLVKNMPGAMAVAYRGQNTVNANISLHNINGQRLALKENQILENGSMVELEIGLTGVYFLTISTPQETRSFKATGAKAMGSLNIATQTGAPVPLKSGPVYTLTGSGTEKGDNVKVSVFKEGYIAQPVEMIADENETLVFPLEAQTAPEVETLEATNIQYNSATLNGNVITDGNSPITERGFYWSSTNNNPGIGDNKIVVEGTIGSYSAELSGLELNTSYYVRAYATNNIGTAYGSQVIFKTLNENEFWWKKDTITAVVDVTNPVTGLTWMDRNLGASRAATRNIDNQAYGDLYQWGRASDGHERRYGVINSYRTLSKNDSPQRGQFIIATDSPYYDWRNPQNANLWQGINGINNPCPSGYRLPNEAEWSAEHRSWSSNNEAGAFASPLKLTVGGVREASSGSSFCVGSYGFYWSSTVDGTRSRYLDFGGYGPGMKTLSRGYGASVRCIKDLPTQISLITTASIRNQSQNTASCGGNITSDGGAPVTVRGVCWNTKGNPTIIDYKTIDGMGMGKFTSRLIGLTANTTYYVRAYATNSQGTAYGEQVAFTTLKEGEVWWPRDNEIEIVDIYNSSTGKTWMDRNLGASQVASSSTDDEAYGNLYQWGRATDGHEDRYGSLSNGTHTLSISDSPGHGKFILTPDSIYDWRNPQNDNLWQGVNGTNNPCPSGYRLPTQAEWIAECQSWSSNNASGAFSSPLKLPMAGFHNCNAYILNDSSYGGYYWSSTVSGPLSKIMYFNKNVVNVYGSSRSYGRSVRCIKD